MRVAPWTAVELVLIVVVAGLAALAVSAGVRLAADVPVPPAEAAVSAPAPAPLEPLAAYAVIAERDLFNPAGTGRGTQTASGLRLEGVALHGTEGAAVIEDASGRQALYRVGDAVGEARVAAIGWDRVTLARAGAEEVLELGSPRTGEAAGADAAAAPVPAIAAAADERIRRTGENAFVVDRRALAGAVDNMSGLLTQMRAVAEVRDGRPAGFRLFQIRDDSLFARLGLRDGDVVQRVNGQAIGEPAALLGFLQRLGSEPRVALDIVRGDASRTLVYDLR